MRKFLESLKTKKCRKVIGGDSQLDSAPETSSSRDCFQINMGDAEKHLLEVAFLFPLVVKVDGENVTNQFRCSNEAGTEIYESSIGKEELSSVRIERKPGVFFRSKNRVFVDGRLVKVLRGKRRYPTGRKLFQRTVLPSVFLLLWVYYAFVQNPGVISFYCETLWKMPKQQHQFKKLRATVLHQIATSEVCEKMDFKDSEPC